MTIEQAWFVLEHGSAEGLKVYLEAIKTIKKNCVDVVRCKDCKHATMASDGKMCKYCEMDTDDFGCQREVYHDADWFCADGERKNT